jgi:hypothetical protein
MVQELIIKVLKEKTSEVLNSITSEVFKKSILHPKLLLLEVR